MQSNNRFPLENKFTMAIQFSHDYNDYVGTNFTSQVHADETLCKTSWIRNGNLKGLGEQLDVTQDGIDNGDTSRIVGIAFNGVPFFSGTSELGYDAFFPRAFGNHLKPLGVNVDHCLGSSDHSTFYHYYSFSPCIMPSPTKLIQTPLMCDEITECKKSVTNYIQDRMDNELKTVIYIGIAKDGHKIMGPYRRDGELWQPCDVDACNGLYIGEEYVYVTSMFFPYTVGCWGPAPLSASSYIASCTTNANVCMASSASALSKSVAGLLFALGLVVLNVFA